MKKIIYLIYLLPVFILAFLFWQNTKPNLVLNYDLASKTPMASALVPEARVSELKKDALGDFRIVKSEPVYFDVRLPRKYDIVKMEIKYSDLNSNIFEAGVSQDEGKKNFNFMPLENKALDGLEWNKIENDGVILYQKKTVYKNIADFLARPADFNKTLLYRADATPKINNLKAKGKTVIDFPIKQSLKLAIYHQGGVLDVRADADDSFDIKIYNSKNELQEKNDLPAGLYTVNIIGGENSVFNFISVNSSYVAVLDKIRLGKSDKPLTIYFAGARLLAMAEGAGGIQKIDANGKIINMESALTQYSQIFDSIKLRSVELEKGDVELNGALFFVDKTNVFYPRYERFFNGANLQNIDFIVARYSPPNEDNGIKTAVVEFDIHDSILASGKLRFLLSLPNATPGELVKICSIKLEFQGERFSSFDIFRKILKLVIRN